MARVLVRLGIVAPALLLSVSLQAQGLGATLSGFVRAEAGADVPNAAVSLAERATAWTVSTRSDSTGRYAFLALTPGDYQLVVAAGGYDTSTVSVTLAGGDNTRDVTLRAALSLGDLGFSAAQVQGNPEEQARLNRRSHMLQIHQRLGLLTAIPLLATVITGTFAGGRVAHKTDRDLHFGLGVLTTGMYFTAASFAIRAPKIAGTKTRGPIRLHKALAWIHGPGMILTPVLGAMAYAQRSRGERVHGIARQHGLVAITTASAFGLALLSVSLKF